MKSIDPEYMARIKADEEDDEDEEEGAHKPFVERLLESRTVLMAEPISAELAESVVTKLLLLDADDSKTPIDFYINSPGGSVDAGFAIFDMIRFINAPVRCICNGLVASAAVIVLIAAAKKNRFSLPNSRFLIHQPSGGARGSTADIKIEADEIVKIRRRINELIAEETGRPVEKVEQDTRRNYWMNASEAQEYGLVSKIAKTAKELK